VLLKGVARIRESPVKGHTELPTLSTVNEVQEQAAQGGHGVSFSGDIPDPSGQGPVQPDVGDPAWAGGWTG